MPGTEPTFSDGPDLFAEDLPPTDPAVRRDLDRPFWWLVLGIVAVFGALGIAPAARKRAILLDRHAALVNETSQLRQDVARTRQLLRRAESDPYFIQRVALDRLYYQTPGDTRLVPAPSDDQR